MNKKTFVVLISVLVVCVIGLVIVNMYLGKPNEVQPSLTGLVVASPTSNQGVDFPLEITGYVNGGGWTGFEGQVGTVKLYLVNNVTGQNEFLATAVLQATNDWTTSPTYFKAILNVSPFSFLGKANLVFSNENPSGLAEKDKTFTLPINVHGYSSTMSIKLYFGNTNSADSCEPYYVANRTIPTTQAVARAALEELLKGPTDSEKADNLFTNINPGVKIQSLVIENGVARVDFNEALQQGVGGSCRVKAIRAQITQTLKQFPTIKDVIISINGRTEDILQP